MDRSIHIVFAVAKLAYSFIDRRDRRFVFIESASSLLLVVVGWCFGQHLYAAVQRLTSQSAGLSLPKDYVAYVLYSIPWGTAYLLFALLSRFLVPKNPAKVVTDEQTTKVVTPLGIIDFSWLTMMSITYTGILLCRRFPAVSSVIPSGLANDAYRMYFDEVSLLFERTVDVALLLGTILAACMAIIWAGELWRKRDPKSRKDYRGNTIAAIKMVYAYFAICIPTAIWIAIPLYAKLTLIRDFLK